MGRGAAEGCCSDGKSAVWTPPPDYSRSCYNPSTYNAALCDHHYAKASYQGQIFEKIDRANAQASDFTGIPNGAGYLNYYSSRFECCSDGKSAVWTPPPDYSRSCKNPSTYNATLCDENYA